MDAMAKLTWAYRSIIIITLLWIRFGENFVDPRYTKWIALAIWVPVLYLIFRPSKEAREQRQAAQEAQAG